MNQSTTGQPQQQENTPDRPNSHDHNDRNIQPQTHLNPKQETDRTELERINEGLGNENPAPNPNPLWEEEQDKANKEENGNVDRERDQTPL